MTVSVQSICNRLSRDRLLPPQEIRNLYQVWLREAGGAAQDVASFGKWLVAKQHLTPYQTAILTGRRNDPLWMGPYKILTRVDQGRMAGIYRAAHPQGQAVAIKILSPASAADSNLLARFHREARLAVRLQHPNVVRTFQAGEDKGVHYLVMELLEGETLKEVLLRRGRLPANEAIRLIYQALQGLQHLHQEGIVHRDLEPANLMLVADGHSPTTDSTLTCTVKILDIGLGRALFDTGTPGALDAVTMANEQLGTPEYRSPEQSWNAHAADIRSDIYSLGCILYHCLVGDPPFVEKNPVRLMHRHATEPPPPLSQYNIAVPLGLQAVLDEMLAKDPALRCSTPADVARQLRPLLTG